MLTEDFSTPGQERELVKFAEATRDTECPPVEPTNPLENEEEYPKGPKLILISLALCLAVFLVALGATALFCCLFKTTQELTPLIFALRQQHNSYSDSENHRSIP